MGASVFALDSGPCGACQILQSRLRTQPAIGDSLRSAANHLDNSSLRSHAWKCLGVAASAPTKPIEPPDQSAVMARSASRRLGDNGRRQHAICSYGIAGGSGTGPRPPDRGQGWILRSNTATQALPELQLEEPALARRSDPLANRAGHLGRQAGTNSSTRKDREQC
jgi:hypothetical protein